MAASECRLCFKPKQNTISIFGLDGECLNAATVIRTHFTADEVEDDDIFPKHVCIDCWNKLSDFHHFYNRVDYAKTLYLVNATRSGYPTVVEVDYNVVECENEQPSVKNEPMDLDLDHVNVVPQKEPKKPIKKPIETLERKVPVLQAPNITGKTHQMRSHRGTPFKTYVASTTPQLISKMVKMSCFYCDHRFSSLDELSQHHKNEHSENGPIRVKCCDTKLEIHELMDHLEYHRNPNKYKCSKCDVSFVLPKLLNKHLSSCNPAQDPVGRTRFECDVCHSKFFVLLSLKRHIINSHTNNFGETLSDFHCTVCNKSLSSKARLAEHVKNMHEQIDQRLCHICGEEFTSNQNMLQHLKTHSSVVQPKVYSEPTCHICGAEFTVHTNIRVHMKRHNKSATAMFRCKQCGMSFKAKSGLRRHSITHEDSGKTS